MRAKCRSVDSTLSFTLQVRWLPHSPRSHSKLCSRALAASPPSCNLKSFVESVWPIIGSKRAKSKKRRTRSKEQRAREQKSKGQENKRVKGRWPLYSLAFVEASWLVPDATRTLRFQLAHP